MDTSSGDSTDGVDGTSGFKRRLAGVKRSVSRSLGLGETATPRPEGRRLGTLDGGRQAGGGEFPASPGFQHGRSEGNDPMARSASRVSLLGSRLRSRRNPSQQMSPAPPTSTVDEEMVARERLYLRSTRQAIRPQRLASKPLPGLPAPVITVDDRIEDWKTIGVKAIYPENFVEEFKRPFVLLSLPQSVLDNIYQRIVETGTEFIICDCLECAHRKAAQPKISRLNRQLCQQTLHMFYGGNKFVLNGLITSSASVSPRFYALAANHHMLSWLVIRTDNAPMALATMARMDFRLAIPEPVTDYVRQTTERQGGDPRIWLRFTANEAAKHLEKKAKGESEAFSNGVPYDKYDDEDGSEGARSVVSLTDSVKAFQDADDSEGVNYGTVDYAPVLFSRQRSNYNDRADRRHSVISQSHIAQSYGPQTAEVALFLRTKQVQVAAPPIRYSSGQNYDIGRAVTTDERVFGTEGASADRDDSHRSRGHTEGPVMEIVSPREGAAVHTWF